MRTAHAVIGSAFGDEGKGLMTDFLARQLGPDTLVVRFNGGPQAGHTVQLPDGRRHVFHHVGSGALAGARTHLSRFFIANPMMLDEEILALRALDVTPEVSIDARAPLTTPFDMMINQMAEEARGIARHGSCGLGINETIKRGEFRPDLTATLDDFKSARLWDRFPEKFMAIREHYVPWRLGQLGVAMTPEWEARLKAEPLIDYYIQSMARFGGQVRMAMDADEIGGASKLIFEGAQGLLLDEDHRFFPHVTHSHTGLTNVGVLAAEAGIGKIEVHYMMRAYMTRHGAGPFPTEDKAMAFEDPTNRPNMWQGSLRFGALDIDLISEAIDADRKRGGDGIEVVATAAIICMDQVGEMVPVRVGGTDASVQRDDLPVVVGDWLGVPVTHVSYGPTAKDVKELVEA